MTYPEIFKSESQYYEDYGYIAKPDQDFFYLHWYDPSTMETGMVVEEGGSEWTEVHEVSTYFNAENDGLFYFVGNEYGEPLKPSYREAHDIVKFEVEWKVGLCPSERLALQLLFG